MAILRRILLILLPVYCLAQPDSGSVQLNMDVLKVEDLDRSIFDNTNTVTSATRLPEDVKNIPFTTFIITNEQIRQRGYNTLVDVLKDLPGIKVSQPGSALHGETFLMRGLFGNYYVKILVDDLPFQPSATSGMPIGAQLPISQAERIEVLYGPAAAIYGADAMAGVINIITRKAENQYMIDVDVAAGIPGTWKFDATFGGKFGKNNRVWNYMFYGGITNVDDMPIHGEAFSEDYNPAEYVPAGEESRYLNNELYRGTATQPEFSFMPNESQKFGFRFGNKHLAFGVDFGKRQTHSAIGLNPLNRLYHDPNTTFGEQIIRTFASYKAELGKWYSQTNLQLLIYEINPSSSYLTIENPTNFQGRFYQFGASSDLYFEQFFSTNLGKKWSFLTGLTMQYSGNLPQFDLYTKAFNPDDYKMFATNLPSEYDYLQQLGIGPYNFTNTGGIAEISYKTQSWIFSAGVRGDYREFYGFALSPRISSVFILNDKNRLRVTASTAYRPPSSYLVNSGVEMFYVDTVRFGLPRPNQELSAESLFNIDAGWSWQIRQKHVLDFSAYFHSNQNLISKTTSITEADGKITEYYGYVNDENASSKIVGFQLVDRLEFMLGSVKTNSESSVQLATGSEVLPFNRGNLNYYRMQPFATIKWLLEVEPLDHFYVGLRAQYFSEWRTRSVILESLEDVLVADGFYMIDLQLRYTFDKGKECYFKINNLTNNAYYGIGASGGVGVAGGEVIVEDLYFNPQQMRMFLAGIRISIP